MKHTSNESQLGRFKEAAREVGADESEDVLDQIMGKLDLTKKPEPAKGQSTLKVPPQEE